MKSRSIILVVASLLFLGVVVATGLRHASIQRRTLASALARQLDDHSPRIATLLATMRGTDVSLVGDAAYHELQTMPSTSLITRSMIKVALASDGLLECTIDTSTLRVAPRRIRQSAPPPPVPPLQ